MRWRLGCSSQNEDAPQACDEPADIWSLTPLFFKAKQDAKCAMLPCKFSFIKIILDQFIKRLNFLSCCAAESEMSFTWEQMVNCKRTTSKCYALGCFLFMHCEAEEQSSFVLRLRAVYCSDAEAWNAFFFIFSWSYLIYTFMFYG